MTGAEEVRSARAASNRAIAERRFESYAETITADFVITTGSGKSYARAEFLAVLQKQFEDAGWLGCVRTPQRVDMSETQPAAAEEGRFECRSRQADGIEAYSGSYLAMWTREADRWKTRSELFVTLTCRGSALCGHPKL